MCKKMMSESNTFDEFIGTHATSLKWMIESGIDINENLEDELLGLSVDGDLVSSWSFVSLHTPPSKKEHVERDDIHSNGTDYHNSTLERKIFDICKIMLQSSPAAASCVMAQIRYTTVHSAIFHGRCCDTIQLLLNVDEVHRKRNYDHELYVNNNNNNTNNKGNNTKMNTEKIMTWVLPATMQANKFGELPLHFAAMRGECTCSIALLSQAAPWVVLRCDVKLGSHQFIGCGFISWIAWLNDLEKEASMKVLILMVIIWKMAMQQMVMVIS
jgi:hypothetical protein